MELGNAKENDQEKTLAILDVERYRADNLGTGTTNTGKSPRHKTI